MSIFKKRTLKPNQLEALRKLEEENVASGKVRCVVVLISIDSCYFMTLYVGAGSVGSG
jgi:hypothetical protein